MLHDEDTVPLPGVLADIERAAGRAAAIAIMDAYGGTSLYLPNARLLTQNPQVYRRRNAFVRIIGLDATLKVSKSVAPNGTAIQIPSGVAVRRARVRQWVVAYSAKFGVNEIARRLGLTRRTVERMRSKLRKEALIP